MDGDIERDRSRLDGLPSRTWAMTAGACLLPIYLAFSVFGMKGKGTAAAIALGTIIVVLKLNSPSFKQASFWFVIVVATIVNILLVAIVPIPNRDYTFAVVAPIGYLEYLLIAYCIRLAVRVK